jgi:hypothetical protein
MNSTPAFAAPGVVPILVALLGTMSFTVLAEDAPKTLYPNYPRVRRPTSSSQSRTVTSTRCAMK